MACWIWPFYIACHCLQMKWMVLQTFILCCKVKLGRGRPGLMRWYLLCIMFLVQDRLLDVDQQSSTLPLYHGRPPPPSPVIVYICRMIHLYDKKYHYWTFQFQEVPSISGSYKSKQTPRGSGSTITKSNKNLHLQMMIYTMRDSKDHLLIS